MTLDLTKLVLHTGYDTFKNNKIYTGSYNITSSTNAGINSRSFTVALSNTPDYLDISFNGPTDAGGSDPRSGSAWFKKGFIWVPGSNSGAGYTNYQTNWSVYTSLNGSTLTITLYFSQQFTPSLTLSSTTMNYRIVDYSVAS